MHTTSTIVFTVSVPSGVESTLYFETIDGYWVSREEGEKALQSGQAILISGLLIGLFYTN